MSVAESGTKSKLVIQRCRSHEVWTR